MSIHVYTFIYTHEIHSVVSDSLWPHGQFSPWNSPGQNTGVVAFPFPRGSSRSRISCIAGGFFTNWATTHGPHLVHFCVLSKERGHLGGAQCLLDELPFFFKSRGHLSLKTHKASQKPHLQHLFMHPPYFSFSSEGMTQVPSLCPGRSTPVAPKCEMSETQQTFSIA